MLCEEKCLRRGSANDVDNEPKCDCAKFTPMFSDKRSLVSQNAGKTDLQRHEREDDMYFVFHSYPMRDVDFSFRTFSKVLYALMDGVHFLSPSKVIKINQRLWDVLSGKNIQVFSWGIVRHCCTFTV